METKYRILFFEKTKNSTSSSGADVSNVLISDIDDRDSVEWLVKKCFEKVGMLHKASHIFFVVASDSCRNHWMGEGVVRAGNLLVHFMNGKTEGQHALMM